MSAVAIAVAIIQTKHKSEMLSLYKMIEKSLFFRDPPLTISLPNLDTSVKYVIPPDNSIKMTKSWNQANLSYFNLYLDNTYREREIVLVRKNIYYKVMVLFI